MAKKAAKEAKEPLISSPKNKKSEELLIANFVALQKVMADLSVKFDGLSKNISRLLELFELSAQALAKKDINFPKQIDEEKINTKLNSLLEQNKIIARGLALMSEGAAERPALESPASAPMPAIKLPAQIPQRGGEKYQKSQFSGF